MRVLAYLRVSTEEQAEEGFSIAAQRQRVADFSRSQWGDQVAITWFVDEGVSARDLNRPALGALRAAAAPGDVAMVLRLDRLTRSVLDLYTLLREWERRGVFFRSVTEPYDTRSTEGRFVIGLLALLAEWERQRIAERVREVMAHTVRAEGRHLSRPPLGYRLEGGRLAVVEPETAIVREIFVRYGRGEGRRSIARALNSRGIRTKQGASWSDFAVAYVLRNPVYAGQVAWGRGRRGSGPPVLSLGHHEVLIDPALWARVRARDARQGGRRGAQGTPTASPQPISPGPGRYPLTGLGRCGLCGGPVHGVTQRRYRAGQVLPGRERTYYRCARRERRGGCALPYLPAGPVELAAAAALEAALPPPALRAAVARLRERPAAMSEQGDQERQVLERRLRRWDQAYEAGDLTQAQWRERTAQLRRQLAGLVESTRPQAGVGLADSGPQARTSPHTRPDPPSEAQRLSALWPRLTPALRRALLGELACQVRLYPGGRVEVEPARGTL